MARIITITSGKGGVGKTSISLNLSLALASRGFRVCLFDADLGLANVNILTGIYPKKDLESVLSGGCGLREILVKNYQGIDMIPGSSGVQKMASLTKTQTGTLISAFLDLEDYDYFIFDTSAGISSQVLSFCMASHEIILVVTTEPTSLTDAYSMLKVLSRYGYQMPVRVVVNQVTRKQAAQSAYNQLQTTVNRFLSVKVAPLGIVVSDRNVRAAVVSQTPFMILFPDTAASRCIDNICDKLVSRAGSTGDLPLELFWDRCLSFLEKQQRISSAAIEAKSSRSRPKEIRSDTLAVLARMEKQLSVLTKEIEDIKALLTDQHLSADESAPKEIVLDFETWIKKKHT